MNKPRWRLIATWDDELEKFRWIPQPLSLYEFNSATIRDVKLRNPDGTVTITHIYQQVQP